jgi:hypothetical protein
MSDVYSEDVWMKDNVFNLEVLNHTFKDLKIQKFLLSLDAGVSMKTMIRFLLPYAMDLNLWLEMMFGHCVLMVMKLQQKILQNML